MRAMSLLTATLIVLIISGQERDAAAYGSGRTLVVPPIRVRGELHPSQPMTYGFNGVPWLWQVSAPWGSLPYGDDPECSLFAEGGCGPTAIAMVLRYYGWPVDPTTVGALAVAAGARLCPGGTDGGNPSFLRLLEEQFDINAISLDWDHGRVLEILQQRQPIIAIGPSQGYTAHHRLRRYGGHFLVLTGVDALWYNGSRRTIVRVNDPGNEPNSGITYLTMPQFRRLQRFLYLQPRSLVAPSPVALVGGDDSDVGAGSGCAADDILRFRGMRHGLLDLGEREWLAYGRALSMCGPGDQPWLAFGLASRAAFMDAYVIPFLNGDVIRGGPFQRQAPGAHAAIIRLWEIEW